MPVDTEDKWIKLMDMPEMSEAPDRHNSNEITMEELRGMFGPVMPIEAMNVLWDTTLSINAARERIGQCAKSWAQINRVAEAIRQAWDECGQVPFPLCDEESIALARAAIDAMNRQLDAKSP